MLRNVIQVYNDTGAGELCLSQLMNSLNAFSPKYTIKQTNGHEICNEKNDFSNTVLLCFGGGYDLGYLESLKPLGCSNIKQYISDGGRFLGLCAGAYFASDICSFDVDGPLKVYGPRMINLFKGTAIGPIYPGFQYNSEVGSRAALLRATSDNLIPKNLKAYCNGGCTFETNDWTGTRVLYEYADVEKPAIIACSLNKGWGILSGVHFEYDPNTLQVQSDCENSKIVVDELKSDDENRKLLFNNLLKSLLDPGVNLALDNK